MQVNKFLKLVVDKGASDIHFTVTILPVLFFDGGLISQEDLPSFLAKDIESALEPADRFWIYSKGD